MEDGQHFNQLTPAEHERLSLCMEEMGEAIQVIGKILRHGYESFHPDNPTFKNRDLLQMELGGVRHSMIRLCAAGDLSKELIHHYADIKASTVEKWLHHQPK